MEKFSNLRNFFTTMNFMGCLGRIGTRPLVKRAYQKINFTYFLTKIYVVGTQNNRLNETVLFSTQNIC